ncbi:hypothetical protein [Pseudomonas jessenii]|uniref:hypothetical protein n=1 Tax=Pseudomonas jessenii TaxID=77298 RepID=UPI0038928B6E
MDSPVYYVESAVLQAPIERRVEDIDTSMFFFNPSSSASFPLFELRTGKITPATTQGAVKIELRFDGDSTIASAHVAGDKDRWTPSYVSSKVEPLTSKLSASVRSQVEAICTLDSIATESSESSRIALRAVVDAVEDHIKNNDLWSLNELLINVDPSAFRKITSVAFLRTSFRMRDKLSGWAALYDRTLIHLNETGQDADRALRGLSRKKVAQLV